MGRYTLLEKRKSSKNCLTILIAVVVSACLIGIWTTMSSIADSAWNFGISVGFTNDVSQYEVSARNSGEFEDSSSDLHKDGLRRDVNRASGRDESDSKAQKDENVLQEFETLRKEYNSEKAGSDDDERRKEVQSRKDEDATRIEENLVLNNKVDDTTKKDQLEPNIKTDVSKVKAHEGGERSRLEEGSNGRKEKIDERKDEANSQSVELVSDSSDEKNGQAELLNGTSTQNEALSTQTAETEKQKVSQLFSLFKDQNRYRWKLCNVTAGPDYIPCLDNIQAIRTLPSTSHYEHREKHCPEEATTCLVPLPEGYRTSVKWPKSRERIWFANVPNIKLVEFKGHQNWVQVSGSYITFPGGGTQFKHGAMHYIDFIQKIVPDIAWGKQSRVVLDVGCGVASFGGYLFDREVLTMSLAPKDKHEAQVQFALERGIPAISAVMGTKRLPFPSMVFDAVHCARCRVPWHVEGGKLLFELDRVLRPGGYFVWSATPVYRKDPEDVNIWKAMSKLTKSMCWELLRIRKDKVNGVSVAVYRKPTSNNCFESRTKNDPPLCLESDDTIGVWNIALQTCIHKVPTDPSERGYHFPAKWPSRLEKPPYWLNDSEAGVYGKVAPKDFVDDYKHWKRVVAESYSDEIGIDWSSVRNVMDMKAVYGGFAAALKDLKLWVMNVVPVISSDTLPVIYERGLFGIYHDWCESFSTYPRSYDLLHADHLFSDLKKRCNFVAVMAEVDRILRPEGSLIVRDDAETIAKVESMTNSLQWKIKFSFSKNNEGLLCVQKSRWRPSDIETISSAIA
ncbi:hypothetical protein BVRB_1g010520 isoform A [Beta vulgaris subsp. vulgaris]|uniref:probable methyltransferase PMT26 isoform X2 n=1 Tax=Beta vulgaris subsp. vulgaris TaxID=3555 RepID=UPI00053FCA5D|nr:probable methyltransferase PMT26 isoform X2 [Beta vulgaris subsp. vulgaris]KMT19665.1 hypothetical protein BVRB_1g010520 isoform A [Beta vulgaris subsp. vulgaris]